MDDADNPFALTDAVNRVARWWMELVRNLLAVAAIKYLASKSDTVLVHIVGNIAIAAFLYFCLHGLFKLHDFFTPRWSRRLLYLNVAIFLVFLALVAFPIIAGLQSAITDVVAMQHS
ncbi:MAG TPA: hypothetical protein VN656_16550 [Stellaceae bacterium]|nr:hypothetical protein [Stellaceae bacterium]